MKNQRMCKWCGGMLRHHDENPNSHADILFGSAIVPWRTAL